MSLPRTFKNLSMTPFQVPARMQKDFASFVNSNFLLKETRFLPPSRDFLFDGIEILINGDKPSNEQKAKQALREFFNVQNISGKSASSRDHEKFLIFWNPTAFKKLFEALNDYDPAMTLNIIKDENNNVSVQLHVNLHDEKGAVVEQCDWSFKFDAEDGFTAGNLHCHSMVFHELLEKQSVVSITEEDIRESTKESLSFLAENDFLHAESKELDESAWSRFIADITRSDKLVFGNPPFGNTPETSATFIRSAEYSNYLKLIDAAAKGDGLEKNSQEHLKDAVNSFIQRRFGKEALTTFHETVIPHYNQNPSVTPASALVAGLEAAPFMKNNDSNELVSVGRKLGTGTTSQRIFYDSTTQQFHYQNTTSHLVFTNTSEPPTEVPLTDVIIHSECYYDKKGSHFLPEKITGPAEIVEFTKDLYLGTAVALPTKKAVNNLEDSVSASDSSSTASTSSSNSAGVRKKAPTIVVEITPPSSPRRRPVQSVPEIPEDDVLKEDVPFQQIAPQPSKEGFFKRAIKNPYVIAALVFLAVAVTLTAIALITLGTAGTGTLPALVATGIGATAFGSTAVGAAIVSTLTAAAATIAGTVGATIGLIAGPFLVAYGLFASGLAVFRRFATSKPLELKNAMGDNSNNVISDALKIKHDAETPKPSSSLANAAAIIEQKETFKFKKSNDSKPAAVDANQEIIDQLLKAFTYTAHWRAKNDMSKDKYAELKLPTKYHPAKPGELGGAKNKLAEEFKEELQKLASNKNITQEDLIEQCRELISTYREKSEDIRTHTTIKTTLPKTTIDYPSGGVEQEVHLVPGKMEQIEITTESGRLEKNFDKLDKLLKDLKDQYSPSNIPRMD